MNDVSGLWSQALEIIRPELEETAFNTWFDGSVSPLGIVGEDTLVVGVPNNFAREWMEARYTNLLIAALSSASGKAMLVEFQIPGEDEVTPEPPAGPPAKARSGGADGTGPIPGTGDVDPVSVGLEFEEQRRVQEAIQGEFNDKYTFDSFVIGESNRFAYAAAQAVAERPGQAYNPLFIYGGSGLGKTHLMQAIGHYARTHYPHMRIKYVSAEGFLNDFIAAVLDKSAPRDSFRRLYRDNDLLLVDDIQFLASSRAEQTQVEFFHTFNHLYQLGKQIVLCSDRPPKDMPMLDERMRSRFEWGLLTDIQPPDLETRLAILRAKASIEGVTVPDDVLGFIAERISSNIRELEGALVRVIAFGRLTRNNVDLELAQRVLANVFPERSLQPISIQTIQNEVGKFFGISKAEMVGNKRSQVIVYPRQMAMYLTRELTDLSLPRIGAEFGGRDHTTVMHATQKITKLMKDSREVYNQVQTLTTLVRQRS
jgi:chromosomal replication initiator protein